MSDTVSQSERNDLSQARAALGRLKKLYDRMDGSIEQLTSKRRDDFIEMLAEEAQLSSVISLDIMEAFRSAGEPKGPWSDVDLVRLARRMVLDNPMEQRRALDMTLCVRIGRQLDPESNWPSVQVADLDAYDEAMFRALALADDEDRWDPPAVVEGCTVLRLDEGGELMLPLPLDESELYALCYNGHLELCTTSNFCALLSVVMRIGGIAAYAGSFPPPAALHDAVRLTVGHGTIHIPGFLASACNLEPGGEVIVEGCHGVCIGVFSPSSFVVTHHGRKISKSPIIRLVEPERDPWWYACLPWPEPLAPTNSTSSSDGTDAAEISKLKRSMLYNAGTGAERVLRAVGAAGDLVGALATYANSVVQANEEDLDLLALEDAEGYLEELSDAFALLRKDAQAD